MLLADLQIPDRYLGMMIRLAIVLGAALIIGFPQMVRDLSRFSIKRIWAIADVCFAESIRRRVLWITPLAILGVIVTVQLMQPYDEQDAIRQTIKYSLFATGTLVVLATIILACTNLPKEIDNRVIYTVVTKPTTRLEIILGKIVGFARVSATILLIMGLFTLIYAQARARGLRATARSRLETLSPSDAGRPSLEHYVQYGLLQSKSYARPVDFQQFARMPAPDDKLRWMNGEDDQNFLVGFDLPPPMFPSADEENGGLVVLGRIEYEDVKNQQEHSSWRPTPFLGNPSDLSEARFKGLTLSRATINIEVLGPDKFSLIPSKEVPEGGNISLERGIGSEYQELLKIPSKSLDRLFQMPADRRRIYLRVAGTSRFRYGASPDSVRLYSPRLNRTIEPLKGPDGKPAWPVFRGREQVGGGQQLRGSDELAKADVAVFRFSAAPVLNGAAAVPAELRLGIEGSGDDVSGQEAVSRVVVEVHNPRTGLTTPPIDFPIESNHTAFFNIPAAAMSGGNFEVRLRGLAPGHYLLMRNNAASPVLQLAIAQEPFAFNLLKSLLVMWLMSLLVVVISIFCSTFVSWPIAVVLTTVILLGHWGAMQIGDTNAPGLGAQISKDVFGADNPGAAKVVSESVDRLSALLNAVAKVLPDISQFAATEQIERGVTISSRVLLESVKVILAFGAPLTVLAYAFLKNKEVAP